MNDKEYKELSIKEFTKASKVYETDRAGVYKMCKNDYPDVLAELEKEMAQYKKQDEDILSYALFPQVAKDFFEYREAQQTGIDGSVAGKLTAMRQQLMASSS